MEAICHLNWKETVMESSHIHSVGFYQRPPDKWIYINMYILYIYITVRACLTVLARTHRECLHCVHVWIHSAWKDLQTTQCYVGVFIEPNPSTVSIHVDVFSKGALGREGGVRINKQKKNDATKEATSIQNVTRETRRGKYFFNLHGMIFAVRHTTVNSKQIKETFSGSIQAQQLTKKKQQGCFPGDKTGFPSKSETK